MTALRAAVVGGGIGGLAAAYALRLAGADVTVFEQASRLGEVGAGVGVAPNGMRMFERLGLRDRVQSVAAPYGEGSTFFRSDGSEIGPMTTSDSGGEYTTVGVHRADLVGLLAETLPDGVVRTGHRVVSVDQDPDSATIRFADGSSFSADVVIGADGIHSVLRSQVTEPTAPTSSGSIAYRGLVPTELIPWWPKDTAQLWMGEGKHFLTYPVRSGVLLNYVGFVPHAGTLKESWSAVGDPDALRADFVGWDEPVERLLALVDRTFWWGLYDREPLERWSAGRVTLLGDAAHAMLPHLGQGANQAIEDGVTLAALLEGAESHDVEGALLRYESIRRERTAAVQSGARDNGRRYDSDYRSLEERDAEIVASRAFRHWIYDYDADAVARGRADPDRV
jgi:salicylate hydroxylase